MKQKRYGYQDVTGRLVYFNTASEREKAIKNFPEGTYKRVEK